MGSSLGAPARCPLCKEESSDLVTLKCNHRFCQPCIGDLWSTAPDGPYHCPSWRCTTVYQTLPFDRRAIPKRLSRSGQTRSAAGTSTNEESTSDSALRRPSLARRLLGKRRASASAAEQPEAKRSTVEPPPVQSGDAENSDSGSSANTPAQSHISELPQKSKSTQSESEDGSSTGHSSVKLEASDVRDVSGQQAEQESLEVISVDDSDSLDEISDAAPAATPRRDTGETPASPASPDSSAAVPPPHLVNSSPVISDVPLASISGSPSHFGSEPRSESKSAAHVSCHYCPKTVSQPAVKTCLVCGASMCSEHLLPHLDSPVFKNHTLISPVENVSFWRCEEHQEKNHIYCRQCGVCVCTVCAVIGSHQKHTCISIREAESELRGNLKEDITRLQQTEEDLNIRLNKLLQKKEASRVVLDEAQRSVLQQYAAIREALDREEQTALQCVSKEESRVLRGLEEKVGGLRSSLQSVQQGLHILEGLADAKGDKGINGQVFIREYRKTAHLASSMGRYMEQFEAPEEIDQARLACLQRWTEKRLDTVVITRLGEERDLYKTLYGFVPSLDADTAHPKLRLSDNNRGVTYSETQQPYTEHAARFSSFPQVLATAALQGGRWYWEVKVSVAEGRWKVGVCEGRIERKGQKDNSRLGCNTYSWCLACDKKKVEALYNKVSQPVDADGLQRVGVFLDFEEGVLSFFQVTTGGSLVLMHSYEHSFIDPVYPAFSVSKTHLAICDMHNC